MSHPMTRTNIDIDDELLEQAMQLFGTTTKKETVELALRRLVGKAMSREEALSMEGSGWDGNLEEMGEDPLEIWP